MVNINASAVTLDRMESLQKEERNDLFYIFILSFVAVCLFLNIKNSFEHDVSMMKPRYGWSKTNYQKQSVPILERSRFLHRNYGSDLSY